MYIIHGTQHIKEIIASGKIKHVAPKQNGSCEKGIYTLPLFRGIPHENMEIVHWHTACIVLKPAVLREYKYKYYGDTMLTGKGNYKRCQNISIIKKGTIEYINKHVPNMTSKSGLNYMHSPYILFTEDIDLHKYCVCITQSGKIDYELKSLCDTVGIIYKSMTSHRGLNKYIDLIENKST